MLSLRLDPSPGHRQRWGDTWPHAAASAVYVQEALGCSSLSGTVKTESELLSGGAIGLWGRRGHLYTTACSHPLKDLSLPWVAPPLTDKRPVGVVGPPPQVEPPAGAPSLPRLPGHPLSAKLLKDA